MKIKKMRMKKNGDLLLKTTLNKRDNFDYATAVRLSNNTIPGLTRFTFTGDDKRPIIYYNITDLVSLTVFLDSKLSLSQFKALVDSLLETLKAVNTAGLVEKNLLLSREHVYVDEGSSMHLVYLPLSGLVANERPVLDLLSTVASSAKFVDDEDKQFAEDFLSYVKKQQVFSLVEVRAYLEGESASAREKVKPASALFEQQKPVSGRDFVSEVTGIQAKSQVQASRSVTENVVHAISGDLSLSEEPGNRTLPKRFVLTRISDGVSWPLRGERFVIGRSINCDIRISDSAAISRQHAVFKISQDQLLVEDAGSANGTFINGERLAPGQSITLQHGDTILLGDTGLSVSVM